MRLLIGLLIVFILLSCATSPTGRHQLLLMSDQDMDKMGLAAFNDLKSKQKLSTNQDYVRFTQCVSQQLIKFLPANYVSRTWEIQVFQDEAPNAFALPGEKIGVHTGMIDLVEDADQLAAVIGHEIGHVIAKHSNERVSSDTVVKSGMGMIDSFIVGDPSTKGTIMGLLGAGAQYGVILPFSRSQEAEADVYGQEIMAKAGFDPRAAARLWEIMGHKAGNQTPEFMSTHPSSTTRINGLMESQNNVMPFYQQALARGQKVECKKP